MAEKEISNNQDDILDQGLLEFLGNYLETLLKNSIVGNLEFVTTTRRPTTQERDDFGCYKVVEHTIKFNRMEM